MRLRTGFALIAFAATVSSGCASPRGAKPPTESQGSGTAGAAPASGPSTAAVGAAAPAPAAGAPSAADSAARGVDAGAMDRAASPGDDFYAFSNGGWLRTAEIPPDRASIGAFQRIADEVEKRNRAILDEAARSDAPAGSDLRRVGDIYASYMDEAAIEAKGAEPVRPSLARIAAIKDKRALATELGALVRADVDAINCTDPNTTRPLGLWVEQDINEPSRNTAYLMQGGLGMPDRSYYLEQAPRFADIRAKYETHLAALLGLAGVKDGSAIAKRVVAFETKLARAHATREDTGDVAKANNPWARAEFARRAPGMDWTAFLRAAGLDRQPAFIIWQPSGVVGLAALVKSEPLAVWKEYLTVRALERNAPLLSKPFVDEMFAFHGTTLTGTPKQRDRWKRGLGIVDATVGHALSREYVQRHFPPDSKAEVDRIVEDIRAAFARRIDALDWMTPETKQRAKAKLAVLEVGIGYPEKWRDYSGLEMVRGDLVGNVERASLFEYRRNLAKLGEKPDRKEWCMLPHEVNAVNLPIRNALNFPAAIMEPPFYDKLATAAVNYAGIGGTVGHEISHSFDDQGAQFDERGKLENWWSPADLKHFESAGTKLVEQYSAYKPFPDLAVNGRLTLGENIADLAGLAAAYDGWRGSLGGKPAPTVDGLTGDQQFFVAYAQSWQGKYREPALRQRVLTDSHAPGPYRALTVRNMDEWYTAFDVKPGQSLYLAPGERVRMW